MQFILKDVFRKITRLLQNFSALEIYTDGSCKNGLGSWAYVISKRGNHLVENSGRIQRTNSTLMEFQAAIEALSSVPVNSKIILFSDSKIMVDAMHLGRAPHAFQSQFDKLRKLNDSFNVNWRWVKAHNGNKWNERCDELCVFARI